MQNQTTHIESTTQHRMHISIETNQCRNVFLQTTITKTTMRLYIVVSELDKHQP